LIYVKSMTMGHLCYRRYLQQMSRKALLAHNCFCCKKKKLVLALDFLMVKDPQIKNLSPRMISDPPNPNPNPRSVFEIAQYFGS
jgi:hypothetical protein